MDVKNLKDWLKMEETEHMLAILKEKELNEVWGLRGLDMERYPHQDGFVNGITYCIQTIEDIAEDQQDV